MARSANAIRAAQVTTFTGSAFAVVESSGVELLILSAPGVTIVARLASVVAGSLSVVDRAGLVINDSTDLGSYNSLIVGTNGVFFGTNWTALTAVASDLSNKPAWLTIQPRPIGSVGYAEVSYRGWTFGVARADGSDSAVAGTPLQGLRYLELSLNDTNAPDDPYLADPGYGGVMGLFVDGASGTVDSYAAHAGLPADPPPDDQPGVLPPPNGGNPQERAPDSGTVTPGPGNGTDPNQPSDGIGVG